MQSAPDAPPGDDFVRALTDSQSALKAFCLSALGGSEDAKDALQRANVVLWRKSSEWDRSRPFLAWAFGVARFEVLGVLRDRQRQAQRLILDADVVEQMCEVAEEEAAGCGERREALSLCLERVQGRQREVLYGFYVFGQRQSEIAAQHGMGLSAVKVLLLRLRRVLAECVERRIRGGIA